MKRLTKRIVRSGVIAVGLAVVPIGAAFAGEWRLNPRECPDLREDRRDARHDYGWSDRREDRRDHRVVHCPAHAWYYVPHRYEPRSHWHPARPTEAIIFHDGRSYYRGYGGGLVHLNITLRL